MRLVKCLLKVGAVVASNFGEVRLTRVNGVTVVHLGRLAVTTVTHYINVDVGLLEDGSLGGRCDGGS